MNLSAPASVAAKVSFPNHADATWQQQDYRRGSISWKNLSRRNRIASQAILFSAGHWRSQPSDTDLDSSFAEESLGSTRTLNTHACALGFLNLGQNQQKGEQHGTAKRKDRRVVVRNR
jgi:hypothetical protein